MKKGKRLILGGSSKGSSKEEPKFVDEVTQEPFVSQGCLNIYLKTFHKKTLIFEREVKLRPSDLNHLSCKICCGKNLGEQSTVRITPFTSALNLGNYSDDLHKL